MASAAVVATDDMPSGPSAQIMWRKDRPARRAVQALEYARRGKVGGMDHVATLCAVIAGDKLRWRILGLVRSLRLPDCWIGAGFVRNAIWDHLHHYPASPPAGDVDVLWFDPRQADPDRDRALEMTLHRMDPSVTWSVKNQARMHLRNDDPPYASATDAMRHWPETATAVAVRRDDHDRCDVAAPLGLADLFDLVVRPTPGFGSAKRAIYDQRLQAKGWLTTWPRLRVDL